MRRFFNGIIMGGILGAMLGLMANDNMKPQRKRLMGKTRRIGKQASEMLEDVGNTMAHGMNNLMRRK